MTAHTLSHTMLLRPLRSLIGQLRHRPTEPVAPSPNRGDILPSGFHGDQFLLDLVASFTPHVHAFIETGCNNGSTAAYMARTYPSLQVFTCEPDADAYAKASAHLAAMRNCRIDRMLSPDFLYRLLEGQPHLAERPVLFWLDAHEYGFKWPLFDEVQFITEHFRDAVIMIDDFEVHGRPQFTHCRYEQQVCGMDYISEALPDNAPIRWLKQDYTQRTSSFHPLVGVGVYVCGMADYQLPASLADAFVTTEVRSAA